MMKKKKPQTVFISRPKSLKENTSDADCGDLWVILRFSLHFISLGKNTMLK